MTKKIVFSGCSLTAGNGWTDLPPEKSIGLENKDSQYLWVNLCVQGIDAFKNLELINVGVGGASNTDIFENTIDQITKYGNDIDTVVCQWAAGPRYNFTVGFELWYTKEKLHRANGRRSLFGIDLNRGDSYDRKYLDNLLDRLLALHHIHWEIVKIVKYSNIIKQATIKLGINRVIFVNGACPWDGDYFNYLNGPGIVPESYTDFTKKEILNIDSRSDEDIFKLYQLAHTHYTEAGGIDPTDWPNLYNSFYHPIIDTNFDQVHPGIKSNQLYFQQVSNFLNQ